ncbi:unnamed protein product [Brassica oleracea var. botrytis]|uniref:(rape) hypothetical protein n=1 Tax=Brassica napus TaxID=3708 RepID=A0A816MBR1_BRANA|nr:unnamed protein product [Brassica napus]
MIYKKPGICPFFFIPKLGLIFSKVEDKQWPSKNYLPLWFGVVEVSIAKPYVNPIRNQNGQRNLQMHVDLYLDYYCLRCPQVESIGRSVTFQYVSRRPILAVALLMMHFQD